jgi:hypothetical protein
VKTSIPVDPDLLEEILARRDVLVQAIAAGATSDAWEPVLEAFDGLLATLARLEESLGRPAPPPTG